MTMRRAYPSQQGFSMLEVLIAVLVFSLGMVGLAGLLIYSIQSNHVAYLRTQATYLAHNMADRMAANPAAVWDGDYGTPAASTQFPVAASTADCAAGCTPDELAAVDMAQWSTQLTTFLPKVTGAIACSQAGIPIPPSTGPDGQVQFRPPYGGTCTMRLTWNEANSVTGAQQPQSFYWVFQP